MQCRTIFAMERGIVVRLATEDGYSWAAKRITYRKGVQMSTMVTVVRWYGFNSL